MDCNCKWLVWLLGFAVGFMVTRILVAVTFGNVSTNMKTETPFYACTDDSDCLVKGPGYTCFQYICYPWKDDADIPAQFR